MVERKISRRYPRLLANDDSGALVAIPLSIAPKLLPGEKFVSFPQKKVFQIAETNERLRKLNNEKEKEQNTTTDITINNTNTAKDTVEKTCNTTSEHEDSTSPLTHSPSPSTASHQTLGDSSTETTLEPQRSKARRLWSAEEDEIVLRAVRMKEPGSKLLGRLPSRSRSAVMQRFYKMKELYQRGAVGSDNDVDENEQARDVEMEVEVVTENGDENESSDSDMDEIPPL